MYAVDTGYGQLAWTLRKDPRVVVMERANALHTDPPEAVDLVVCDMAWTPQKRAIPAAMRWLKPGGRIVSLVKPHYELAKLQGRKPHEGLTLDQARGICEEVRRLLLAAGTAVAQVTESPLRGKGGNAEFFILIEQ